MGGSLAQGRATWGRHCIQAVSQLALACEFGEYDQVTAWALTSVQDTAAAALPGNSGYLRSPELAELQSSYRGLQEAVKPFSSPFATTSFSPFLSLHGLETFSLRILCLSSIESEKL